MHDAAAQVVGPDGGDVAAALPVAFALVAVVLHRLWRTGSDVVGLIGLYDGVVRIDLGGVGHRPAREVSDGRILDRDAYDVFAGFDRRDVHPARPSVV